jgi:hypothetical protein
VTPRPTLKLQSLPTVGICISHVLQGNGDCSRWKYVGNTVNMTYLCKSDSAWRYLQSKCAKSLRSFSIVSMMLLGSIFCCVISVELPLLTCSFPQSPLSFMCWDIPCVWSTIQAGYAVRIFIQFCNSYAKAHCVGNERWVFGSVKNWPGPPRIDNRRPCPL